GEEKEERKGREGRGKGKEERGRGKEKREKKREEKKERKKGEEGREKRRGRALDGTATNNIGGATTGATDAASTIVVAA
ncbi:hypothetical protein ACC702_39820, partial [Rhizobium ruizarguesonis]